MSSRTRAAICRALSPAAKLKFDRRGAVVMTCRLGRLSGIVLSLALAVCTVLTPALAQRADIDAMYKAFQENYARGNYPAAQIEAQKLEQAVKARVGINHPGYAAVLASLANVYFLQGKYAEAEGLYKRALAIREQALGANHPDVAQTLNNLACQCVFP